MERELEQLIKEGAYDKLLAQTAQMLAANPNDGSALAYRGRALASTQLYDEASQALRAALRYSKTPKRSSAIHSLDRVCRAILSIETAYIVHSHESEAWAKNWYNLTLSEVIRANQEAAGSQPLMELWREKTLSHDSAYILGSPEIVDNFNTVDSGVSRPIREPLPRFPASQADGLGYIYARRQTYLCPFGFPKRLKRYRKIGPEPIAEFPVVKWESKGRILKPNRKCDVFYSTDAVEGTIDRLLRWSLDRLAAQRQDFFVPQYHNIIDPNLTAVLYASEYRWTATDFIIKEVKVPRQAAVFSLQGCIRRIIGRGLPWHSAPASSRNLSGIGSSDRINFYSSTALSS